MAMFDVVKVGGVEFQTKGLAQLMNTYVIVAGALMLEKRGAEVDEPSSGLEPVNYSGNLLLDNETEHLTARFENGQLLQLNPLIAPVTVTSDEIKSVTLSMVCDNWLREEIEIKIAQAGYTLVTETSRGRYLTAAIESPDTINCHSFFVQAIAQVTQILTSLRDRIGMQAVTLRVVTNREFQF